MGPAPGIAEVERWLETGPLGLDDVDLQQTLDSALGRAADSERLVEGVTLAGELVAGVPLALVMTFFFVKDGPCITRWFGSLVPAGGRDDAAAARGAAWAALGAYVRGTAVVGAVNGVIVGIGLAVIGVPLVVPLGWSLRSRRSSPSSARSSPGRPRRRWRCSPAAPPTRFSSWSSNRSSTITGCGAAAPKRPSASQLA